MTLAFGYLVLPLTAIGVAIGSATNVFAVIKKVIVIIIVPSTLTIIFVAM